MKRDLSMNLLQPQRQEPDNSVWFTYYRQASKAVGRALIDNMQARMLLGAPWFSGRPSMERLFDRWLVEVGGEPFPEDEDRDMLRDVFMAGQE
jgi:hypothetical protein